jgi:CubicO group peptidase (beta-lactamase class C family)
MSSAADIAARLLSSGVAPRVSVGCAIRQGPGFVRDIGGDTGLYFDLASLTKPMTALATARSGLGLHTTLGAAVPELASSASASARVLTLLSHRAGLRPHVPLYLPLVTGGRVDVAEAVRSAADARREECRGEDGEFAPVYSDLGYILAGVALARHARRVDAGRCVEELVAGPLGIARELGTARSLEAAGVPLAKTAAPTEDVPWRGGIVRGRVHDENAWALTGEGGSGHAGMFGTVDAVLELGGAILEGLSGRGPLADAQIPELVRERPGGTLRAGFDGKSASGSAAGELLGPRTFGHLGFTGTSLFIDPDAEAVVVVLTNRIHPSRDHLAIRAARPGAHDALFRRALEL